MQLNEDCYRYIYLEYCIIGKLKIILDLRLVCKVFDKIFHFYEDTIIQTDSITKCIILYLRYPWLANCSKKYKDIAKTEEFLLKFDRYIKNNCVNVLEEEYKDRKIEKCILKYGGSIVAKYVVDYSHLPWDWDGLSSLKGLRHQFVINHHYLPWNITLLEENMSISRKDFNKIKTKILGSTINSILFNIFPNDEELPRTYFIPKDSPEHLIEELIYFVEEEGNKQISESFWHRLSVSNIDDPDFIEKNQFVECKGPNGECIRINIKWNYELLSSNSCMTYDFIQKTRKNGAKWDLIKVLEKNEMIVDDIFIGKIDIYEFLDNKIINIRQQTYF